MFGLGDKMQCDREEGEIIEENGTLNEVGVGLKDEKTPRSTLHKVNMSNERTKKAYIDDFRSKVVRFKQNNANETRYYDRDSRLLREANYGDISQRRLITYDNDCFIEIDNWEDGPPATDKDTRTKKKKLEDLCIKITTENNCSDKRSVKNEPNDSKRIDDQNKLKAESSSSLAKNKNDTRRRTDYVNMPVEAGEIRKRKRSDSPRSRQANKQHKNEPRAKRSHVQPSCSKSDKKHPPSDQRRNTKKQPPFKHFEREKKHSSVCFNESVGRNPFPYNKKEFTKNKSPVLLEDGKRVLSPDRDSLRSCSPVSDVSWPQFDALDARTSQNHLPSDTIVEKEVLIEPGKEYTVTKSTSAEKKREIAVAIYIMLVHYLSTSRPYVTLNVLKDIIRSKGIYLKQNGPTYLVTFAPGELLEQLVRQHKDIFVVKIIDLSVRIWPKTDVKICSRYTNKPNDSHLCDDLHICKYYTLATCDRKNCRFSHSLTKNPHNKEVLETFFLENFDEVQIQRLMQTKESRNFSTLPLICKFYNNEGGCDRPNCMHLHLCKYFIMGECKFNTKCLRQHKILRNQPDNILKNHYGLSLESEYEAKILISKTLKDGTVKLKKDFIKHQSFASTQPIKKIEEENLSTTALLNISWSQKMGKTSRQKTEATSKRTFSRNSLPNFIPLATTHESDDSDTDYVENQETCTDAIQFHDDKIVQANTDTNERPNVIVDICTNTIHADNDKKRHEDNDADSKEMARKTIISSTSILTGESSAGKSSKETSTSKHDDKLEVTNVKSDIECHYSNTKKANNPRVSLTKDILDEAECITARGGSEWDKYIDQEKVENAVVYDSKDGLAIRKTEAVTVEHDAYSKQTTTDAPRVCHIEQQTADVEVSLVLTNDHTSIPIDNDNGNETTSPAIHISSAEDDRAGTSCVNNIPVSANVEKDCKNECSANIGDDTIASSADSTTTIEIFIECKQDKMARQTQFRHNSGNWQISTSSGMWKNVNSDYADVMNKVAQICGKFALHNACDCK